MRRGTAYLVQHAIHRRIRDLDDTRLARKFLRCMHIAQAECARSSGVYDRREVLPIVRRLGIRRALEGPTACRVRAED